MVGKESFPNSLLTSKNMGACQNRGSFSFCFPSKSPPKGYQLNTPPDPYGCVPLRDPSNTTACLLLLLQTYSEWGTSPHKANPRRMPWPSCGEAFVLSLPKGSLVADLGCGRWAKNSGGPLVDISYLSSRSHDTCGRVPGRSLVCWGGRVRCHAWICVSVTVIHPSLGFLFIPRCQGGLS